MSNPTPNPSKHAIAVIAGGALLLAGLAAISRSDQRDALDHSPSAAPPGVALVRVDRDGASPESPTEDRFPSTVAPALPGDDAIIRDAYRSAQERPAATVRGLFRLRTTAERDAALHHAVAQWAVSDARAAEEWTCGLGAGPLRDVLLGAVATARAEKDPRGAAELVADQMSEGVPQRNAAVAVAQRWVQRDGPAAMAWVLEFPSVELRSSALDAALRVWLAVDAGAAERWISGVDQNFPQRSDEVRAIEAALRPSAP